jgi:predicted AAA+ superfamily ATPase
VKKIMAFIPRIESKNIKNCLENFPAVAILGPRQCGKSTLARHILSEYQGAVYLDLEDPGDVARLTDPALFLQHHSNKLVCLDEVQRMPGIFQVLRSVIDRQDRNGQFLLLGSASRDLVNRSSESLAGRLIFIELNPFSFEETVQSQKKLPEYHLRGGFPRSFLAGSNELSFRWRKSFISTFLERDLSLLGFGYPPETMRKLWMMCAHQQGQVANQSALGQSLGVSHTTVRSYLDLLKETFMIRVLHPWMANTGKRLVKTPKVYLRDTGILHALLNIRNYDELLGHPVFGPSWESLVIEQILAKHEGEAGFYRTSSGAEIDLVLEKRGKKIAVECKASATPSVGRGFYTAMEDLQIDEAFIAAPVNEGYPIKPSVRIVSLEELMAFLG